MYKRYLYIVLLASIGCHSSEKQQREESAQSEKILVSDQQVVKGLPISHIFDTVTFIPLTNNKQGAAAIDKIFFTDDKILILDKEIANGVFMYDEDGRFLGRVGRIGRGPGEYIQISDFDYDGENILISDHSDMLLLFDKDGNFIEKKRTKFSFFSFASTEEGYLFYNEFRGNYPNENLYNIIETTKDLRFVKGHFPFEKALLRKSIPSYVSNFVRNDDGNILFSEPFTNKVYMFDEGEFHEKFTFSFENRPLPESISSQFISPEKLYDIFSSGYSQLVEPFYTSSANIFFKVVNNQRIQYIIQSPAMDDFKIVDKFTDDFYGIPIYYFVTIKENKLVANVSWESIEYSLKNTNEKDNKSLPKLQGFAEKYKVNADSFDPVIAIFRFKE